MSVPPPITQLLEAVANGEEQASDRLLERVYGELHRVAERLLRREAPGSSMQATILVHDAWLALVGEEEEDASFEKRAHFFGAAAKAMRRLLVQHARARRAQKRGGDRLRVTLPELPATEDDSIADQAVLDLHSALEKLEGIAPEVARVVELRYFAGLTIEETARALERSTPTVKRHWVFARAWLHDRLEKKDAEE